MENGSIREGAAQWSTIFFRNQVDVVLLGQGAGAGDFHGQSRGPVHVAWVKASVEAKPHPPPAITRMPNPKDCDSLTWEVLPFLVEI